MTASKQLKIHKDNGFSLIEMVMIVAVLGILAAIVVPAFQDYAQQAKEAVAKDGLRMLRNAIEVYTAQHNGIAPGYKDGDPANGPSPMYTMLQLLMATNAAGQYATPGTSGYDYGPYFRELPENPFNGNNNIWAIQTAQFSQDLITDFGWIYNPATGEIKLNTKGTDSNGILYFDY